jgi:hypothetical protein
MNFYEQGSQAALVKLGFGKTLGRAWGELGGRSQQALKQYAAGAGVGAGLGGITGAAVAPEGSGGTGFMLGALGGGLLGAKGGRTLGKRMSRQAEREAGAHARRAAAEEARFMEGGVPFGGGETAGLGGDVSAELQRIRSTAFPRFRPEAAV